MNDTTETREYQTIQVSGTVSVELVECVAPGNSTKILLLGPTGGGKSSFIEAIDEDLPPLRISSNQLEGFTQSLSTYRVNGVTDGQNRPIYLIDSPGFADTKISEMAIVSMLQQWARINQDAHFDRVLYLYPITFVRLPGSQRQIYRMFKDLIGSESASTVTLVTTMWDNIWGENAARRAEINFEQLQNDVWRDYIEEGAQIARFFNTRNSALSILDEALSGAWENHFSVLQDIRQAPVALDLYRDLQARIQNLHFQRAGTQLDLSRAILWGDNLLEVKILSPRLRELEGDLAKFQKELQDFGPPPALEADQDNSNTSSSGSDEYVVDISQLVAPTAAPRPGQLSGTEEPAPSDSADTQQAATASDVIARAVQPQPRTIESLIAFMKCWGKSVGERHEN